MHLIWSYVFLRKDNINKQITILNLSTLHTIQTVAAESATHWSLVGGSDGITNLSLLTADDILWAGLDLPGCDRLNNGLVEAVMYEAALLYLP